jgi:hypothetical protein
LIITRWIYIVCHNKIIFIFFYLYLSIYTLKATKRLPLSNRESKIKLSP